MTVRIVEIMRSDVVQLLIFGLRAMAAEKLAAICLCLEMQSRSGTMQTEQEIQREILQYLKKTGYLAEKVHMGSMRVGRGRAKNPLSGFPDILAVAKNRKGVLVGIEVKTVSNKLSEEQEAWRERLEKNGAIHIVARSLEDVIRAMAIKDVA